MEKEALLSHVKVAKSDLGKALVTRKKDLIEKVSTY